jgi:hypothetical protein
LPRRRVNRAEIVRGQLRGSENKDMKMRMPAMLTMSYFSGADITVLNAAREKLGKLALKGILACAKSLEGITERA